MTIQIQLTKERFGIIDDCDADLAELKWHFNCGYVARWIDRKKTRIHRIILSRMLGRELVKGECCDHINGDGLDNCRDNLRLCSKSENGRNRGATKHNRSGLKGAYREKNKKRWFSQIWHNGKSIHLGTFDTAQEAHEAFNKAAIEYHGEFAKFK